MTASSFSCERMWTRGAMPSIYGLSKQTKKTETLASAPHQLSHLSGVVLSQLTGNRDGPDTGGSPHG